MRSGERETTPTERRNPVPAYARAGGSRWRARLTDPVFPKDPPEGTDVAPAGLRVGLRLSLLVGGGVSAALAGHPEAWFGVGLVLSIVGIYTVRWTRLPMPTWLGVGLLVAVMAVALTLALR